MIYYGKGGQVWQTKYKIKYSEEIRKDFQDHIISRYWLPNNLKATLVAMATKVG